MLSSFLPSFLPSFMFSFVHTSLSFSAIGTWDMTWLKREWGHRLVPVEVG
jgi:hypothetical protein